MNTGIVKTIPVVTLLKCHSYFNCTRFCEKELNGLTGISTWDVHQILYSHTLSKTAKYSHAQENYVSWLNSMRSRLFSELN